MGPLETQVVQLLLNRGKLTADGISTILFHAATANNYSVFFFLLSHVEHTAKMSVCRDLVVAAAPMLLRCRCQDVLTHLIESCEERFLPEEICEFLSELVLDVCAFCAGVKCRPIHECFPLFLPLGYVWDSGLCRGGTKLFSTAGALCHGELFGDQFSGNSLHSFVPLVLFSPSHPPLSPHTHTRELALLHFL